MYNLMQCVASGHTVVALAHLKPLSEGKKLMTVNVVIDNSEQYRSVLHVSKTNFFINKIITLS